MEKRQRQAVFLTLKPFVAHSPNHELSQVSVLPLDQSLDQVLSRSGVVQHFALALVRGQML